MLPCLVTSFFFSYKQGVLLLRVEGRREGNRLLSRFWIDCASIKSRGGFTRGRGVTESLRTTWTKTAHRCSSIQYAMTDLISPMLNIRPVISTQKSV